MQPINMGFVEAVKTCFSKAFTFTGRARRSEYWYWTLFNFLVALPFSILMELVPEDKVLLLFPLLMVYGIWNLFSAIASLAVSTRRLHDIGRSGWWYGGLMIFCFLWVAVMVTWLVGIALHVPIDKGVDYSTFVPFIPWVIALLVTLIPYMIYSIVLLVWYCTDSTPGPNKYGENPKEVEPVNICAPSMEIEKEIETIE